MSSRSARISSTAANRQNPADEATPDPAPVPRRSGLPMLHVGRSRNDYLLTGVAGGIGERLGVDPVFVRAAFVVLATAGGVGILLYLLLWVVTPPNDLLPPGQRPPAAQQPRPRKALAFGLIILGSLLLLRELGLWFGNAVVWPVAMAAVGSAVISARSSDQDRARWGWLARRLGRMPGAGLITGPSSVLRIIVGALLVFGGMATFLTATAPLAARGFGIGEMLLPMLVTLAGATLILAPWIMRLGRQLSDERRERIRSEERAEVAAHLHDSVLQTLALIQRSEAPREMAGLAAGQERELRAWLYGRTKADDGDLLSKAVDTLAGRIERLHQVKVETVVVGDGPLDERSSAVLRACGEALSNAARHSGAAKISVYVEAAPDVLTAFVNDDGKGFDMSAVPPDRRGISESIIGRMERHGGSAEVVSEPGEGTEVQMHVPRAKP